MLRVEQSNVLLSLGICFWLTHGLPDFDKRIRAKVPFSCRLCAGLWRERDKRRTMKRTIVLSANPRPNVFESHGFENSSRAQRASPRVVGRCHLPLLRSKWPRALYPPPQGYNTPHRSAKLHRQTHPKQAKQPELRLSSQKSKTSKSAKARLRLGGRHSRLFST